MAKKLKCKHVFVRKLISNGYLKAKITEDRHEFLLISRESVEEYISSKDHYINRTEVCSILNISYQSVIDLDKNILKVRSSPTIDGSAEVLYDRRKVDQIFRIIEKRNLMHIQKNGKVEYKTEELTDLTKGIKYSVGTNIADMVTLVILGKIIVVEKNDSEIGLKKYLLIKSEIWEQSLNNKIKKRSGVLSIPELSHYLDIGRGQLNAIIKSGFLKPTEQMEKPYIPVEDAINFKDKYVTLSQLSKIVSKDMGYLSEIISGYNKDIHPILVHSRKKNNLYKIDDVKFLFDKIF